MPRRTSQAKNKDTAVDSKNEGVTPRRSGRAVTKQESSTGKDASRSRRSSTAAQTAASVADSKSPKSRGSTSSRRESTSPSDSRTRSGREGVESPATRVKSTRRSTGRINYKESDGEEETPAPKYDENFDSGDEFDDSDSDEKSKPRGKSKPTKPAAKGRGSKEKAEVSTRGRRGRPSKKKTETKSKTFDVSDDSMEPEIIETKSEKAEIKEKSTVKPTRGRRSKAEVVDVEPETKPKPSRRSARATSNKEESPKKRPSRSVQAKRYAEDEEEEIEEIVDSKAEEGETEGSRKRKRGSSPEESNKRVKEEESKEEAVEAKKKEKIEVKESVIEDKNLDTEKSIEEPMEVEETDSGVVSQDDSQAHEKEVTDTVRDKEKSSVGKEQQNESLSESKDNKSDKSMHDLDSEHGNQTERSLSSDLESSRKAKASLKKDIPVQESSAEEIVNQNTIKVASQSSDDSQPMDVTTTEPKQNQPSSLIVETKLSAVASETKPSAFLSDTKPPALPLETKPALPLETKPALPLETKPALPLSTKSHALPTETKPSALPADTKPSALRADTKPSALPVGTKPSALPSEIKSSVPSETKSSALPLDAKSSALPSDTKPALPSDTKPTLPSDTKSALPSDTKSSTLPSETKPSILPLDRKPPALPSGTKPPALPFDAKPSALTSGTKPSTLTSGTKPSTLTSGTKPFSLTSETKPFPLTSETKPFDLTSETNSESKKIIQKTESKETKNSEKHTNDTNISKDREPISVSSVLNTATESSSVSATVISDPTLNGAEKLSNSVSPAPVSHISSVNVERTAIPVPKANGAHENVHTNSTQHRDQYCLLPGRKYVLNSKLNENVLQSVKNKTFGFLSYNLGSEMCVQKEKLLKELHELNSHIICLQQVPKPFYSSVLQPSLDALGYKSVFSQPEDSLKGMATFFKSSQFRLNGHSEISLRQLIDKELETSSLEPTSKAAVKSYIKRCGNALLTNFTAVIGAQSVFVVNVQIPSSDLSTHALQVSCLAREAIRINGGTSKPLLIGGEFNISEKDASYQLLRDGYLSNDMIDELQRRKDIAVPEKENSSLVDLLWKYFQHPSSNLCSCYTSVLDHELFIPEIKSASPDLLWYSSGSLHTVGVVDVVSDKPGDRHLSLKADIAFSV